MSVNSWVKEFYPITAKDAAGSDLDAIDHAIKKFEGASYDARSKHKVFMDKGVLSDHADETFYFDSTTCALCLRHFKNDADLTRMQSCRDCPLAMSREGFPCDYDPLSPFRVFLRRKDSRKMIEALKNARAMVIKKQQDLHRRIR
jgi:hypothetical protein